MKKFLKFFVFLLIVPLVFSLGACKKKKNNNDDNSGNQQEQPVNPNPDDGDDNPGGGDNSGGGDDPETPPVNPDNPDDHPPVIPTKYSVAFDYALPTGYQHLLDNQTIEKELDETIPLLTINDAILDTYFLGWYDKTTNEKITTEISFEEASLVNIYAKWDETNLKRYYCTPGVSFSKGVDYLENSVAVVSGIESEETIVVLPKFVEIDGEELPIRIFDENSFKNSNVTEVITSNLEGIMINNSAFQGSKLNKFNFTNVYSIGSNAFDGTKLENVVFDVTLTKLGSYAFANSTISSVDFSRVRNISSLPEYLFNNAINLSTIKLSDSINQIQPYAFCGCDAIEKVDFLNKVITINSNAFDSCSALTEVNITSLVSNFGYNIFNNCLSLEILNLSKLPSYNSFSLDIFFGESILSSVKTIVVDGDNITSIETRYFSNMTNLERLTLPNNVTAVGDYAFSGCVKLENFNLPTSLNVNNFSLNAVTDTLWYKNLTDIMYFNNGEILLLAPLGVSGDIVIADGTKTIMDSAFANNTSITSVVIPSTVETIGLKCFENCTELTTVTFEENNKLLELKNRTFYGCSKLNSINLSECLKLEKLSNYALAKINNFNTFILPPSLKDLDTQAFYLTSVMAFDIVDTNEYFKTENGVVYSKDMQILYIYPNAKNSVTFSTPASVINIKDYAFVGVKYLTNLYITNQNLTIGDGEVTDLFKNYQSSTIKIFVENKDFIFNDYSARIVCYKKLDSTEFEWTDLSDMSTLSITADPNTFNLTHCFIRFTVDETEYFYTFKATIVSGETSVIQISNIKEIVL